MHLLSTSKSHVSSQCIFKHCSGVKKEFLLPLDGISVDNLLSELLSELSSGCSFGRLSGGPPFGLRLLLKKAATWLIFTRSSRALGVEASAARGSGPEVAGVVDLRSGLIVEVVWALGVGT